MRSWVQKGKTTKRRTIRPVASEAVQTVAPIAQLRQQKKRTHALLAAGNPFGLAVGNGFALPGNTGGHEKSVSPPWTSEVGVSGPNRQPLRPGRNHPQGMPVAIPSPAAYFREKLQAMSIKRIAILKGGSKAACLLRECSERHGIEPPWFTIFLRGG